MKYADMAVPPCSSSMAYTHGHAFTRQKLTKFPMPALYGLASLMENSSRGSYCERRRHWPGVPQRTGWLCLDFGDRRQERGYSRSGSASGHVAVGHLHLVLKHNAVVLHLSGESDWAGCTSGHCWRQRTGSLWNGERTSSNGNSCTVKIDHRPRCNRVGRTFHRWIPMQERCTHSVHGSRREFCTSHIGSRPGQRHVDHHIGIHHDVHHTNSPPTFTLPAMTEAIQSPRVCSRYRTMPTIAMPVKSSKISPLSEKARAEAIPELKFWQMKCRLPMVPPVPRLTEINSTTDEPRTG